jgi:hypothetical protein
MGFDDREGEWVVVRPNPMFLYGLENEEELEKE